MFLKKLPIVLFLGLSTHLAWASSDNFCEPDWTLKQRGYDRCSSLPMLSPGNDTRVNLKLLLVDKGLAALESKPAGKQDTESGYGRVPFSLETFESSIFQPEADTAESGAYMSGSRCISDDSGKADFIDAVEHVSNMPAYEKIILIETRKKMITACDEVPPSKVLKKSDAVTVDAEKTASPEFKQFMQYMKAASAFYDGRYGDAESGFTGLAESLQPWLKEASLYMLGRTGLNLAQQDAFDAYGYPDLAKVDQNAMRNTEIRFNSYLKEYPDGSYAASARGLLRRVYWMSNQPGKLADEYAWQLNNPDSPQHNMSLKELATEADNKMLCTIEPGQVKDPLLLATIDLSLMRVSNPSDKKQISFADLQKQQPLFTGQKELFEYLLAAHVFYVQKDVQGALKRLPDTVPIKMTYVDFSRLVLRGLALEAANDFPAARKLWLALLPLSNQPLQSETLQLALAVNYEYSNKVESVFEADSPVKEPLIRNILLRSNASGDLLRKLIKSKNISVQERHIAIYTLLYKDLFQGHYQDYIKDYRFLPADAASYKPAPDTAPDDKSKLALFTWSGKKSNDSYGCSSTFDIARRLAKNPADPYGLICLGDFAYVNSLESSYAYVRSSGADRFVLGAATSMFSGKPFNRGDAYQAVMAAPGVTSDLKAYALYRSINCYSPSGYNHCSGKSVEKSVRKAWFRTLKTDFKDSKWSQSLKYYW